MSNLSEALDKTVQDLNELTATFNRMGQTLQEFGTACGPVRRSRWSRAVPYITVVSAVVLLACIILTAVL